MTLRCEHINIFYPYRTPAPVVHAEIEMAYFIAEPVVKSEPERLRHGFGVVNPHHQTCSVHLHRRFDVGEIGEDQLGIRRRPFITDGLLSVLEFVR